MVETQKHRGHGVISSLQHPCRCRKVRIMFRRIPPLRSYYSALISLLMANNIYKGIFLMPLLRSYGRRLSAALLTVVFPYNLYFGGKITENKWYNKRKSHFRHDFYCELSHFRHDFYCRLSHFRHDFALNGL